MPEMKDELLGRGDLTKKVMVPTSEKMNDWLKSRADKEHRPVSQIVRFAVAHYAWSLEQEEKKQN